MKADTQKSKTIFFDWGRVLYNPEEGALFSQTKTLLKRLSHTYRLCVISLATAGTQKISERMKIIKENNLEKYFSLILMDTKNKDALYEKAVEKLGIKPQDLIVVDDRVIRGIRWGNRFGAETIWVRNGKFSQELPNAETGKPTYTIMNLEELKPILMGY